MSTMRVKIFNNQTTAVQARKIENEINDILAQEKAGFVDLKETTTKLLFFYNLREK